MRWCSLLLLAIVLGAVSSALAAPAPLLSVPGRERVVPRVLARHVWGRKKCTWDGSAYEVALWPSGAWVRARWNYTGEDPPTWQGQWKLDEHTGTLFVDEHEVAAWGGVTTSHWRIRLVPYADGHRPSYLRGFLGWPEEGSGDEAESDILLVLEAAPLRPKGGRSWQD